MTDKKHTPSYTAEFRTRGVRLFREHRSDYSSDSAAYRAIASKLGCSSFSLRDWCRRAARDAGELSGPTSEEKARSEPLKAPLVRAQWRAPWSVRTVNCAKPMRS